MTDQQLTHIDEQGDVRMVDVSHKADTERVAVAEGFIAMKPGNARAHRGGQGRQGRRARLRARGRASWPPSRRARSSPCATRSTSRRRRWSARRCRRGEREDGRVGIHVTTTCGVTGKTGIEMEALTAASVACLTVYDMCKAVDRGMEIADVRLLKKDGGKTGLWER